MTGHDASAPVTAPATPPAAPPARSPGWIRVLLFASLALNLAVVGIVAGTLAARRDADGVPVPRDMASALYLRALPEPQREAFARDMRHEGPRLRLDRAALRAEAAATLAALRTEPFDPAAFAARIAEQRRALTERVSAGDRLLVARLAAMTPAERHAYADRLEGILRRMGRGRGD